MRALAALVFLGAGALAWWLSSPVAPPSSSSLAREPQPRGASPVDDEAELEAAPAPVQPRATELEMSVTTKSTGGESAAAPRDPEQSDASVVHGTILDVQGAPIEEVWAVTIDAHGVRRNQRTRPDGTFAFADLPAGKFRLQGGKLGWLDASTELDLVEGEVRRCDLALVRAPTVRLRCGDGAGRRMRDLLADASFSLTPKLDFAATAAEPGELLTPPHPGGNNTYAVGAYWDARQLQLPVDEHPEAAGVLVLRASPPVWVSLAVNQHVVCKRYVQSTAEPLHLTFTVEDLHRLQAALRLVVVDDETGDPQRAQVTFGSGRPNDTAEDGTLALERLPSGPHTLCVDARGFGSSRAKLSLAPGQTLDLGEVRLRRPERIAGKVIGSDGAPLLVEVVVEPLEGDVGPHNRAFTQSGAEGGFELPGFPAGQYVVRVRGDDEGKRPGARDTIWTSTAVTVDTRLGPSDDVVLVAEPPVPFLVEVPSEAAPLQLCVVDAEGRGIRRWAMVPEQFGSLEPRALKLPQGRFELIVSRDGVEVGRWPIEVGPHPGALRIEVP